MKGHTMAYPSLKIKKMPVDGTSNAINMSGNKETVASYTLVCVTRDGIDTPVQVSLYMGRSKQASVVYASVWIQGKGLSVSGSGNAGGYGYCKSSAAVAEAFESAGVVFDRRFGGTGTAAIRDAMQCVARKLGYSGRMRIIS